MAGSDRNAARRVETHDRELHGRRGTDSQVDGLAAGGEQPGHHRRTDHRPRRARVAADQNATAAQISADRLREGDGQFGREGFAYNAANASNADLQRFHIYRLRNSSPLPGVETITAPSPSPARPRGP